MTDKYDIAVLGAGPGGYIAALKAGQLGAKVAIVEKGHLGGTCLNVGCIPSKAILATSELIHSIGGAAEMGVRVDGSASVDWSAVQQRKDKVIRTLRGGIKQLFKGRGVDLYQGTGRLAGDGQVTVSGDDGETTLSTDKIILATGSTPIRLPGWPDDPALVCTTDEALHWAELPRRLLIVGGGVIGCEFACMMQPLGVEVTLVEMMPQLLPNVDRDIATGLAKVFAGRGITIHTDTKVEKLDTDGDGISATLSGGETVTADRCLVSVGRRPATEGLGLETVGIETDRGFVRVDDRMRTSAQNVYCIGDANGRALLAHAASAQGVVAVEDAMGHDAVFDKPVPNAVYTFPEVASVGLTADQAEAADLPAAEGQFPLMALGKAMAAGHTEGMVKVVRHRESGALLGVHMLGHNATECIAAAGAMLGMRASTEDLAETIIAHPTISESIKEAAEDALNAGLHLPPRRVKTLKV